MGFLLLAEYKMEVKTLNDARVEISASSED
jgi:hypothetical protein